MLLLPFAAFCSAFTVTDLLNPKNVAERQNDEDDNQILPVFLITFIGALLVNILKLDKDIQEKKVQGILSLTCLWFFLAPTGAQGVTICVRLSFCLSVRVKVEIHCLEQSIFI